MPSDVEVANTALLKVGEGAITSFTDAGKPALLANNTYNVYRDALLRQHEWSFAIRRTSLAASATGPDWEFTYSYPLPAEPYYCLRVLTVQNLSDYDWRVEGRAIVTDMSSPLYIRYIWKVVDPEQWDTLFVEAFAAKLAWEWSESLAKEPELRQSLLLEYKGKMDEAFTVDGQEGKTEPLPQGSWVDAHV